MMTRSVNAAMAAINAFVAATLPVETMIETFIEGVDCPVSGDDIAKYKARKRERDRLFRSGNYGKLSNDEIGKWIAGFNG